MRAGHDRCVACRHSSARRAPKILNHSTIDRCSPFRRKKSATHERESDVSKNMRAAKNKFDSKEVILLGGSVHAHHQDARSIVELP
jgi:hypothetical protein